MDRKEPREIILDSSIWISYLDKDDSQHKKAVELMRKIGNSNLIVTEYILLEIVTVIKQKGNFETAWHFIKQVQEAGSLGFIPSEQYLENTISLFGESEKNKLSFVDLSLVALSSKYEVLTFDNNLQKILSARSICLS
jgi:predicted nucleic acid-binding protein